MKRKQLEDQEKKKDKEREDDEIYDEIGNFLDILELPVLYDCGNAFKEAFETNTSLYHVDLSYNWLKESDC